MPSFLCDAAIAVEVLGAGYIAGSFVIHAHHHFKQASRWVPQSTSTPQRTAAKKVTTPKTSVVVETDGKPRRKPTPVELLRQQCQQAGIKWRNAHGKNKHLKKAEMIEALKQLERNQRTAAQPNPVVQPAPARKRAA